MIKKITASIKDGSFFKKSAYNIQYFFTIFLIKCSLYANRPRLTALIFSKIAGAGKINTVGDYVVLCVGRTVFLDDVKAMAKFSGRIRYLVINKIFFEIIFAHFTEASEREKVTESNYHNQDYCAEGKLRYNRYLREMLPRLKELLDFDAILSGNFAYIAQEEVASVCVGASIPFIVLHKEAFDVDRDFVNKYRGCEFIGAKLLLYNNRIKEALLYSEAHVGGISERALEVVGVPRFDSYFSVQAKKAINPQIVFFSFYPQDYFPDPNNGDSEKMKLARLRVDDFHKLVMDFARRHPDIRVVIKTKFAEHYMRYVENILKNNFDKNIPNLIITNSTDLFELISDSTVVVGYSSTVLVEAIIANRTVISPYFADLINNDGLEVFFQKYPELIRHIRTQQEFDDLATRFQSGEAYDSDKKKAFLERLIFTPDGRASIRAENAIINTIKQFRGI